MKLRSLWQKQKFFFCHNVFKSRLLQRGQKASVCGKVITILPIVDEGTMMQWGPTSPFDSKWAKKAMAWMVFPSP